MRSHRPSINLTTQCEQVLADLCTALPDFAHIDPRRLLVCLTRSRRRTGGGTFAKIVPMRFPDGSPLKQVNGHCYALPQIPTPAGDVLYLIYLYIPRFFEQSAERRVLTLVHELYHIAPAFNGTIRRQGSRAHSNSRERFNAQLQPLVTHYLTAARSETSSLFLQSDLPAISRQGTLIGRTMALPKPVRLACSPP